jgi:hypothetical protein
MNNVVKPDTEDFETIYRKHGRSNRDESDEELAKLYRLAQSEKLIRVSRLERKLTPEGEAHH